MFCLKKNPRLVLTCRKLSSQVFWIHKNSYSRNLAVESISNPIVENISYPAVESMSNPTVESMSNPQ